MVESADRSREDLGQSNRRRVLGEIFYHGPVPRTGIAERTGLTAASVSRITRDLVNAGLVQECKNPAPTNRSGRRLVELSLKPDGGYVLGIGINAFAQVVSLADLENRVIAERPLDMDSLVDPAAVVSRLAEAAQQLIEASGIDRSRLLGAGVAIAGAVDPARGVLVSSQTLGWEEFDFGPRLSELLGLPVYLDSLPNCINLAETRFGIARGSENVVVVSASLQLGGSLLLDNNIRRGRDFSAALFGDLRVSASGGIAVTDTPVTLDELVGGRGVMCSLGLAQEVAQANHREVAQLLVGVTAQAAAGDAVINARFCQSGEILGRMIDTIWRLLRPETIILAGPMVAIDAYVQGVRKSCLESDSRLPLKVSTMTSAMAARWLALNEFLITRNLQLSQLMQEDAG